MDNDFSIKPCCVNAWLTTEGPPCGQTDSFTCGNCFLVQYCSKECQQAHWDAHKVDCKGPLTKPTWKPRFEVERREPAFLHGAPTIKIHGVAKYLWGNVPAVDIIKHEQNEGEDLPANLRLLFAASGDLRNVIKSLIGLPKSYTGKCEVVINDLELDVVARNVIMLLVSLTTEPKKAAAIMMHVWYSSFMPKEMVQFLQDNILPMVQDVCSNIQDKAEDAHLSRTWEYGTQSLRLVLQKSAWDRVLDFFQVPEDLSTEEAREIMVSTTFSDDRQDYIDRALYNQKPATRLCIIKFRKEGALIPYGASADKFNTPNPTLFHKKDPWPMMDSADPLKGWNPKEVKEKATIAKNDVYGSLCMYLQDLLEEFCSRSKSLNIFFDMYQFDATHLPFIINQCGFPKGSFDRIEVSNLTDTHCLGVEQTLETFGPLLKDKSDNRHATLIGAFLNAIYEAKTNADDRMSTFTLSYQCDRYMDMSITGLEDREVFDADFHKYTGAATLFYRFDELFQRYALRFNFDAATKSAGLKVKPDHTIIDPWPLRLNQRPTREEFERLLESKCTGGERYVEWEKDDDTPTA